MTYSPSDENVTAGTNATIFCHVFGIENLMPTLTFVWLHFDGTDTKRIENNSSMLVLSPLRLSDAGEYRCQVKITSPLLKSDLTITSMYQETIRLFGKCSAHVS